MFFHSVFTTNPQPRAKLYEKITKNITKNFSLILGAYGIDIGTDLPTLLNAIVPVIPEGCMMRIGMTNPPYILDHLKAIGDILNHPRVYAFMHIPVQV